MKDIYLKFLNYYEEILKNVNINELYIDFKEFIKTIDNKKFKDLIDIFMYLFMTVMCFKYDIPIDYIEKISYFYSLKYIYPDYIPSFKTIYDNELFKYYEDTYERYYILLKINNYIRERNETDYIYKLNKDIIEYEKIIPDFRIIKNENYKFVKTLREKLTLFLYGDNYFNELSILTKELINEIKNTDNFSKIISKIKTLLIEKIYVIEDLIVRLPMNTEIDTLLSDVYKEYDIIIKNLEINFNTNINEFLYKLSISEKRFDSLLENLRNKVHEFLTFLKDKEINDNKRTTNDDVLITEEEENKITDKQNLNPDEYEDSEYDSENNDEDSEYDSEFDDPEFEWKLQEKERIKDENNKVKTFVQNINKIREETQRLVEEANNTLSPQLAKIRINEIIKEEQEKIKNINNSIAGYKDRLIDEDIYLNHIFNKSMIKTENNIISNNVEGAYSIYFFNEELPSNYNEIDHINMSNPINKSIDYLNYIRDINSLTVYNKKFILLKNLYIFKNEYEKYKDKMRIIKKDLIKLQNQLYYTNALKDDINLFNKLKTQCIELSQKRKDINKNFSKLKKSKITYDYNIFKHIIKKDINFKNYSNEIARQLDEYMKNK